MRVFLWSHVSTFVKGKRSRIGTGNENTFRDRNPGACHLVPVLLLAFWTMKKVAIIFGLIVLMMFGYSVWSLAFADCICTCTPSPSATVTPTATSTPTPTPVPTATVTPTPIGSSAPVDIVMDFTGGSPGDLVTIANLTSSTHNLSGVNGTWSLTRTPADHTNLVASPVLPLLQSIICGDTTYSATSGRAMKFDADVAVAHGTGSEDETYSFSANTVGNVTLGSMSTFASTLNTEADMFIMYSSFSVIQFYRNSSGGTPYFEAHSTSNNRSQFGPRVPIIIPGPFWISHRRNKTSGLTEVVVQDGVTGRFIGCSHTSTDLTTLTSLVLTDYIAPQGGNFKHSIVALAFNDKATLPLAPGAFVLPPLPSVAAYDGSSGISLDLGDGAQIAAFGYKIERSSDGGDTWSTIQSYLEVPLNGSPVSPYLDTTTINGVTYKYRVTAILGEWSSTTTESNSLTKGAATWQDTADPVLSDSDDGQQSSSRVHSTVISLPAGTVSKLRVFIGADTTYPAPGLKIALYDNSGHLVTQQLHDVSVPVGYSNSWKELNVPITAIPAGTYRIAWISLSSGNYLTYRYKNGIGASDWSTADYTTFAQSTFAAPYYHVNGTDAAGVFIAP